MSFQSSQSSTYCKKSSFSEINNPSCNQKLTDNINAYLNSVIDSKLLRESGYWNGGNINLPANTFIPLPTVGSTSNYRYLSATELLSGHISVSGLSLIGILIPPLAVDLFAEMTNYLGRVPRIGDTFSLSISNSNANASLFLMTNVPNGSFSSGNSTYNGWLDRFILVGSTSTYWVRVESVVPESYSFFKPNVVYNNFSTLPNAASMFPDSATVTAAIAYLHANVNPLGNNPPTSSAAYDTGVVDPKTGVPP